MRIIGGTFRGRRLAPVRGEIRPTGDRLRESLFNVVGASVRDSVWLDAFCGTGAIGLEALSRGARLVIFNDKHSEAIRLLKKNLGRLGIEERYQIHSEDLFALLRRVPLPPLDFIFLDPPYPFRRYLKLLERIRQCPSLQDHTLVILEVFKKTLLDLEGSGFEAVRTLREGDGLMMFLKVQRPAAATGA